MKFSRKLLMVLGSFLLSAQVSALTIEVPGYQVINEFNLPPNLSEPLGDLLFSNDGVTAYIINNSERPGAGIWSAPVIRNSTGNVTGFGAFSLLFTDEEADTGLTFGPGTDTFFYRVQDIGIAQRFSNGTIEDRPINNYDDEFGGLAFVPDLYPNAGDLLSIDYRNGQIWRHEVTADGDGSFTIADASLVASGLPTSTGSTGAGDLEFITTGPLAGSLLLTNYGTPSLNVAFISLDANGNPADGPNPTLVPFATDSAAEAWGLAVDPITSNIWVINFNEDSNGFFLSQIGAISVRNIPVNQPMAMLIALLLLAAIGGMGIT